MWIERYDHGLGVQLVCTLHHGVDDAPMSAVYPVEIADTDNTSFEVLR
jgi:hypothetical protein